LKKGFGPDLVLGPIVILLFCFFNFCLHS
jgi:hypothetical protein